jgi:flagellar biosynthesis component FlhA
MQLLSQAQDLDTIIILQNRLTEVRYDIESSESRIRVLENQVQYATLTLTLMEVLEEKEVEEAHVVTYGEKVMNQFKDMWENTVEFFQDLLLGIIAVIPGIIFIGIITAVVLIIVFTARKKRRKARAAKALAEKKAAEEAEKKAEEKKSADKKETKEDRKEEKKENAKD